MGRAKKAARRTGRLGAFEKKRLFAAAWIVNGQNGQEAARSAGYTGTDASLRVKASKLLTDANVQMVIRENVNAVADGMKSDEVIARLTTIARLMDTAEDERADIFDFIRFLEPKGAQAGARKAAPEPGWKIDLLKAKRLGKGHLVKELSHDAQGAPKIKLKNNRLRVIELSLKALVALAKIRGMFREQPPSPPRRDTIQDEALKLIPLDIMRAFHAAWKEAIEKVKATNVQAQRVGE